MIHSKVTCITVCRNDKNGLLTTMESALSQTQSLYEVVVIDGASTDGTPDELPKLKEEFESKGIQFQYVSESDTGIYNAMNKGIKMATGDWAIFMNAGDRFASSDVIEKVFENKIENDIGIVYGDYYKETKSEILLTKSYSLDMLDKEIHTSHQAMFFSMEILHKRPYDETLYMGADYDWVLNYYKQGGNFLYVPVAVCIFNTNGLSSRSMYDTFCECMKVRQRYGVAGSAMIVTIKKMIIYCLEKVQGSVHHMEGK